MKRTPVQSLAAVALAFAVSAAVAGCGSSTPSTLSAKDYKTKANAICKTASDDIKKLGAAFNAQTTEAEISVALTKAADRIVKEVADLKKLAEPTSLTKDADALYAAELTATDTIKTQGINLIKSGNDPFKDADTKARALGLTSCASSSA